MMLKFFSENHNLEKLWKTKILEKIFYSHSLRCEKIFDTIISRLDSNVFFITTSQVLIRRLSLLVVLLWNPKLQSMNIGTRTGLSVGRKDQCKLRCGRSEENSHS